MQPIWSPDGRSLAYVASVDGRQHIFVKDLSSPSTVPVLQCLAICDTVSWSPDGARIFYGSRTTHLDARLWSVARTGGNPALVFKEDVQLLAAAMSADGKRLAVLRVIKAPDGPGYRYGLFVSDPLGAPPVRFEPFPLLHLITPTRVAWSADSSRLFLFSGGTSRLYVMSLADRTVNEFPVSGRVDLSWGAVDGDNQGRLASALRPAERVDRTHLPRATTPNVIGANDLFIGAHARALGIWLVWARSDSTPVATRRAPCDCRVSIEAAGAVAAPSWLVLLKETGAINQ